MSQIAIVGLEYLPPWGVGPAPLSYLSEEEQQEILELVKRDRPPSKWRRIGSAQIYSRAWIEWYRQRGLDPHKQRVSIPKWMREAVLNRDGYVCQLCGDDVRPDDVHIDHIKPVSLGGENLVENLQVAHSTCNMSKGARV